MNGKRQNGYKRIALVDWTWAGHHPTYFNHLLLAFEELGVEVLALCPHPEEAEQMAAQTRSQAGGLPGGRTQFKKIHPPTWKFGRLRPRWISGIYWTFRHFLGVERQIRQWSRASGEKVDAVFYACMYVWDFDLMHTAQLFLRLPWMGLYIQTLPYRTPEKVHARIGHVPRPETMFRGRLCRGIAILDEEIVERVSAAIGKPVTALPDLTDERVAASAEDRQLGDRLKEFAAGRPIVGLFGHLHDSKGVRTFLEAARLLPENEVCFALGGEVWGGSHGEIGRQIQSTLARQANLWTHLERIPGEPSLNHLLAACDVIVAAYWDFPHSSGIQTKAALLRRPLIVSDGYLMAERSRRYHLGEVIHQKDPLALCEAILKITRDPEAWLAANQPRWTEYCARHTFVQLKEGLRGLLAAG